jgi:hypothetical protein
MWKVVGAAAAIVLVSALTLRGASFREGRLLFGEESPRDVQPLSASYQH